MTIHTSKRLSLTSACAGLAVGAAVVLVGTSPVSAGGGFPLWQGDDLGSPSDYGTAGNWDLGFVPGAGEFILFNGSASSFTVDLNGDRDVNAVTFSGVTPYTLNGSTLTVGNFTGIDVLGAGAHTINSHVAFTDGVDHDWSIGTGGSLVINGDVSNAFASTTGLIKSGTGTLTLNGTNTNDGGIVINAGVLEVADDTALGNPAGEVTLNGSDNAPFPTLRVNGVSTTTRDFQAGQEFSFFEVTDSYTVNGVVSDAPGGNIIAVSKEGDGTLTLGGVNTNTFQWSLGGGTLAFSSDVNLGDTAANTALEFNGGRVRVTSTHSTNRDFVGDDKFIEVDAGQDYTVHGVIRGGTVIKLGDGTLTLTAVNDHNNGTIINRGVLSIADDAALGPEGNEDIPPIVLSLGSGGGGGGGPVETFETGMVSFNGGTLRVTADTTAVADRAFVMDAGNGTFDIVTAANDGYTIPGPVSGVGSLTKTGAGTLTLDGLITYTGDTILTAGTLSVGTASLSDLADVYLTTGATMHLNFAGNDVINDLLIDDVSQQAGTYGAIGSAADFPMTLFTGLGLLEILLPGDLDGDGFVGINDLNIVLANWNQNVPPANPLADPSGDGFVGIDDLNEVLGNWNAGVPPGASANVPEPASFLLMGAAGILSMWRRRAVVS